MWGLVAGLVCLVLPLTENSKRFARVFGNLGSCVRAEPREEVIKYMVSFMSAVCV